MIYLFLVRLSLQCYVQAFASCGQRGLLPTYSAWDSLWWLLLLQSMDYRVLRLHLL